MFDSPADGKSLVKCVIGVPGDTVELDGARLVVNGRPAEYYRAPQAGLKGLRPATATQKPWVLRDNRDNSADSRYISLVPRRNFVGRAQHVVVSFDPDHHELPRAERWWKPLI